MSKQRKRASVNAVHLAGETCQVSCQSEVDWANHVSSKRHKTNHLSHSTPVIQLNNTRVPAAPLDTQRSPAQCVKTILSLAFGDSLINQTISTMFSARTSPFPGALTAHHLRRAATLNDFLLTLTHTPSLIIPLAITARNLLASNQLELHDQTITTDEMTALHFDCLFRKLSQSPIGENLELRRVIALQLTQAGFAPHVLSSDWANFYSLFDQVRLRAETPGTSIHYTTHITGSNSCLAPSTRQRRRSDPTAATSSPLRFLPDHCSCLRDENFDFPAYLSELISNQLYEDRADDDELAGLLGRMNYDDDDECDDDEELDVAGDLDNIEDEFDALRGACMD